MANPLSLATVNHIRAGLGIAYVSRVQQDLVLSLTRASFAVALSDLSGWAFSKAAIMFRF